MNFRTLSTLLLIADAGSFAAAARRANMTLSSISMQMKALEEELDAALFDRTFRPPRLTPLGRQVADQARRVVAEQDALIRLCQTDGVLKGHFRIGFVPTSSVRLLPDFLARARAQFRSATFEVETALTSQLLARVAGGLLDIAVITGAERLPDGVRETVLAQEELVYCLPQHAANWDISHCMASLPFVQFLPQAAGIGQLIAQHLRSHALQPRETIVLDTVEAVAECVRCGVGFGILPRPDVSRYVGDAVALRSLSDEKVFRKLVLVTRAGTAADAGAEMLAATLTD